MVNSRSLAIIAAVLVFGLMIEGLKGLSGLSAPKTDKLSALNLREMDIKPFHVSKDAAAEEAARLAVRPKTGGIRLAKLPESYDFSEGHRVAKKQITLEGTKEDPKKKKKRKKIASGRGKGKKKFDPFADQTKKYPESEKSQGVEETLQPNSTTTVVAGGAVVENDKKLPITYEDWAKLVLGRPQPENVAKLIEYFNNGMVGADVFYALLTAMVEESNPEQHLLAVFAAGNVPNNQSFIFLVDVLRRNPSARATAKASEQIEAYETLHNVKHLKGVLTAAISDDAIVQLAVGLTDRSTERFLDSRSPAEDATDTEGAPGSAGRTTKDQKLALAKKTFISFEPVLVQVLAKYADQPSITGPAQKALNRIKNLTVVVADLGI